MALSRVALPALAHALIASVATWPMLTTPTTRLVGHPQVDVWNHAWGGWWFLQSALQGTFPLYTRMLGAPRGGYLWYIDPWGATFSMPFVAALGVVAAWNLLIFAYVCLASVAGRSLALSLGASRSSAWLAAVATGLSPYVASEIHNGISEAVGVGWAVLSLAALGRATREGATLRDWAWVGLWGGVTAVGTVYYALGLAITALPVMLFAVARRSSRPLLGVATGAAVAAAIAGPAAYMVRLTIANPARALIDRPNEPIENQVVFNLLAHNASDPRSFYMPGDFQSVDLTVFGEMFRHTSYIGVVVLVLALVSRRWVWLGAAALTLTFSLGPYLYVRGDWYRMGEQVVALPYRLLFEFLPTNALGHPQRVVFPGLAVIYALAAVTLARAPRWAAAAVAAAVAAEFLVASPSPWPISRTEAFVDPPAEYIRDAVRDDPARAGIVFDLPSGGFGLGMLTSRYLLLQTIHGQPIPYAPDVRASGCKLGSEAAGVLLRRDAEAAALVTEAALAQSGVRFVVTHGEMADTTVEDAMLVAVLGEPTRVGQTAIYRVDP